MKVNIVLFLIGHHEKNFESTLEIQLSRQLYENRLRL